MSSTTTFPMIYIGIDPGKSGAVAAVTASGFPVVMKLSETLHDVAEFIRELDACRAVIEQVSAMPGNGVAGMFKFGESYGACLGILTATRTPFKRVTPAKWQTMMRCRTGGNKRITKAAAQRLFPGFKVTNYNADALLLAELCRTRWDDMA